MEVIVKAKELAKALATHQEGDSVVAWIHYDDADRRVWLCSEKRGWGMKTELAAEHVDGRTSNRIFLECV